MAENIGEAVEAAKETKRGRPYRDGGVRAVGRVRKLARSLGISSTLESVRFLIDVRDGRVLGATTRDRIAAADSLLDRFGDAPRNSVQTHAGELPVKMIDLRGWEAAEHMDPSVNGHMEPNGVVPTESDDTVH